MSLFYFHSNMIEEQINELNNLCSRFYDIYESICTETEKFVSGIAAESEESEGLKNNFSIISHMAERDFHNVQAIKKTLDAIYSDVYSCEKNIIFRALNDNENNEPFQQESSDEWLASESTEEELSVQENIDEQLSQESTDEQFSQENDDVMLSSDNEQQSADSGFISSFPDESLSEKYIDSQQFGDSTAESLGAVSADSGDALSMLYSGNNDDSDSKTFSFFSNDDFNSSGLSVFGNSVKNSKSLIISLAISGLSSVLAGGSFKFLKKRDNPNIEI